VAEKMDAPIPINLGTGSEITPNQPDGQPRRCLDTTRARELLSWEAVTALEDGLEQTIDWYRKHAAGVAA
jgi:nucleoside-diphosphate-sugar epimerase